MRLLQARLQRADRNALQAYASTPVRLDNAARQNPQPFDLPDNAAIAVYLQASERSLTEPKRMMLQVGLQGTARHSGHRGTMNVGVVLDLRGEVSNEVNASIRALLYAFNKARDIATRVKHYGTDREPVDP